MHGYLQQTELRVSLEHFGEAKHIAKHTMTLATATCTARVTLHAARFEGQGYTFRQHGGACDPAAPERFAEQGKLEAAVWRMRRRRFVMHGRLRWCWRVQQVVHVNWPLVVVHQQLHDSVAELTDVQARLA